MLSFVSLASMSLASLSVASWPDQN